jgi:hypothetical protein
MASKSVIFAKPAAGIRQTAAINNCFFITSLLVDTGLSKQGRCQSGGLLIGFENEEVHKVSTSDQLLVGIFHSETVPFSNENTVSKEETI